MLFIDRMANLPQKISEVIDTAKRNCQERLARGDVEAARSAFDDLRETKDSIKESLLLEQHGLCAYCMQRIQRRTARIEHWRPLSKNTEEALEYANMFVVCFGGEKPEEPLEGGRQGQGKKGLCCDASKGNQEITINPSDSKQMKMICYSADDVFIYTATHDKDLERDINDVLHLNGVKKDGVLVCDTKTNLVYHRRQVYTALKGYLENLQKKECTPEKISIAIKKKIMSIENEEIYPPFAGVLLYFLRRELKRYEKLHCGAVSNPYI